MGLIRLRLEVLSILRFHSTFFQRRWEGGVPIGAGIRGPIRGPGNGAGGLIRGLAGERKTAAGKRHLRKRFKEIGDGFGE